MDNIQRCVDGFRMGKHVKLAEHGGRIGRFQNK